MSWLQRIVVSILPNRWASSMEAESRSWMVRCEGCGYEQSVWDRGGIRWKAAGTQRLMRRCKACHERHWQTLFQEKR